MLIPAQVRELVIAPALAAIAYGGAAAEELMLGTAIQESGLRALHQSGGPALGLWQVEPASHDDLWANFLAFRPALRGLVEGESVTREAPEMVWNLRYACIIARLLYVRSPTPLPKQGDIAAQAKFWKETFNTAGGAGTVEQYVENWNRVMVG